MTLGERIRMLRQARRLTQTQLAGDTVTRNMLSQIESDTASPSVRTLEQLAERLGVSAGWLLCGDETSLQAAREAYAKDDWKQTAEYAETAPESAERSLLLSRTYCAMAEKAWTEGDASAAEQFARRCLEWNTEVYADETLRFRAERVLVLCDLANGKDDEATAAFCETYNRLGIETAYHLLSARCRLAQEHLQAAERDLRMISSVSPNEKGEYLLLRGRLALRQENYTAAATFLRQAEDAGVPRLHLRELYEQLSLTLRRLDIRGEAKKYADLAKRCRDVN